MPTVNGPGVSALAELALRDNLITQEQFDRMTDGTVSRVDLAVAQRLLAGGGMGRILGQQLSDAITARLRDQGRLATALEGATDRISAWLRDDQPLGPTAGTPAGAIELAPAERARLTRLPSAGLPPQLADQTPLWENVFGGRQDQPLNATRLYGDGSYHVFSQATGAWQALGTLPASAQRRVLERLASSGVQQAASDAGGQHPITSADRLFHVTVAGQTREVCYGVGHGGVDRDLMDMDKFIRRLLR